MVIKRYKVKNRKHEINGHNIKGNTAVSLGVAQANISFIQDAYDTVALIMAYLQLAIQNEQDRKLLENPGDRTDEKVFSKYLAARRRNDLFETINNNLPKDEHGLSLVTSTYLKPFAESGHLDDFLIGSSIDSAGLYAKMIQMGCYSNEMNGHSLHKFSPRHASNRTRQKYRPSLPSAPKGIGGFRGGDSYLDFFDDAINRYDGSSTTMQSIPKIEWSRKEEQNWRNKQMRRRKYARQMFNDQTRKLKRLEETPRLPYRVIKQGNKTFTIPTVPKYRMFH